MNDEETVRLLRRIAENTDYIAGQSYRIYMWICYGIVIPAWVIGLLLAIAYFSG